MSNQQTRTHYGIDSRALRKLALYGGLYGTALLFAIPLYRMFLETFMTKSAIAESTIHWFPPEIIFSVWGRIFAEPLLVDWMINSFAIASVTTLLVLLFDSMIAFSLTRLEWKGQSAVLGLILASYMVPGYVNIIPLYTIIVDFGLLNNYLAVILPFVAGPLGVFLLVQFFQDIPEEVEEAARLDGFSMPRIYAQIILPLSRPILTALGLFVFIWSWNQFLWPLLVLQTDSSYTVPIGIVIMRGIYVNAENFIMATMVVASAPLFILFVLFQDKLISAVQFQGTVK